MEFQRSSHFVKAWKKAPASVRAQAVKRLRLFAENEFNPLLHNHKLSGEYNAYRSINVNGDWRIVYSMLAPGVCYLYLLGTHSELYE